jgi:GT2 family glycosyltransferase
MMPKVAVIILAYNGCELTCACLDSLRASTYSQREIWVVDNASTDGTAEAVRSAYPEVRWVALPDNRGYVGGNNAGIQAASAAGADLFFLVNNDTLLDPACLAELVQAQQRHPRAGLLGPMVYTWDQPPLISSAGGQVDWRHADAVNIGLGEPDQGQFPERVVDFINGCGLMVTRQVVDQVGLLDERFFLYWEETDWAARVRQAGLECWFVPAAKMRHKAPIRVPAFNPTTLYYVTRNRLLYMALHAPWPAKPLTVVRALRGAWQGIGQHQRAGRWAHACATQLAIRHAFSRRWGRTDPALWQDARAPGAARV